MRVAFTAALLLLVASQAWGECAWVLWSNLQSSNPASRYAPSSGGLWTPEGAGMRTECERTRDRSMNVAVDQQAMGPGTRALARGGPTEAVGVVGPNGSTLWTCLPDTIDPRRPKVR